MGIAESMNKNMKKNMEEQMKFQKQLILKQRQLQMATQIAMSRQRFTYFSYFTYLAACLLTTGAFFRKDPRLAFPLVPISFAYAFQYDLCYGDMMQRAMSGADTLLAQKPLKFALPPNSDIVSTQQYLRIMKIKDGKKQI